MISSPNSSKRKPKVFRSFMRPFEPIPGATTAMDESMRYLVSDERIAVFDYKLGFHAGISSTT